MLVLTLIFVSEENVDRNVILSRLKYSRFVNDGHKHTEISSMLYTYSGTCIYKYK